MGIFGRDNNRPPPPSTPIEQQPKVLFRATLIVAVPTDQLGQPMEGTADRYIWGHACEDVMEFVASLPGDRFKTDDGRVVEVVRVAAVNPTPISADLVLNNLDAESTTTTKVITN